MTEIRKVEGSGRRRLKINDLAVLRMYQDHGMTIYEIAAELGCDQNTVARRLHEANIPLRGRRLGYHRRTANRIMCEVEREVARLARNYRTSRINIRACIVREWLK